MINQDVMVLMNPELIAFGLLIIAVLLGALSRHMPTFFASLLLALASISFLAPGALVATFGTIGFAVGSLFVAIVGLSHRRRAVQVRRELDRLSTRVSMLEAAESHRIVTRIRSVPLAPNEKPAANGSQDQRVSPDGEREPLASRTHTQPPM
jgi:uncharacterized membrane protein YciS (DUF1049 family)